MTVPLESRRNADETTVELVFNIMIGMATVGILWGAITMLGWLMEREIRILLYVGLTLMGTALAEVASAFILTKIWSERVRRRERTLRRAREKDPDEADPDQPGPEWAIAWKDNRSARLEIRVPSRLREEVEYLWACGVRPGENGFVRMGDVSLMGVHMDQKKYGAAGRVPDRTMDKTLEREIFRWDRSPLRTPERTEPSQLEKACLRVATACRVETGAMERMVQEEREAAGERNTRMMGQRSLFEKMTSGTWPDRNGG